jgi:oligopeptide/dipeptide ABC transporter ATP-binding protein
MTLKQESGEDVLSIKDLRVTFHTYAGDVKALDGVDLTVKKGELLGLVGESGCGKSVTSLAVTGLLPANAEVVSGSVRLDGRDLLRVSNEEMRKARLSELAIVFQDPMTYLNPVLTVGSQITEIITSNPGAFRHEIIEHRQEEIVERERAGRSTPELQAEAERLGRMFASGKGSKKDVKRLAADYVISILRSVKLPRPEKVMKLYPFELSGGMRQRVMIAMALVRRPKLLLADEITTALDVTVQAQILQLLRELKSEINASVVLITHDLGVVAEVCDRVAVMYAGNIVEVAEVGELFENPMHPYTRGLLASVPRVDDESSGKSSIPGSVPDLIYPPSGCRFHPRCPKAFGECPKTKPALIEVKPGHFVACLLYGGVG